MRNRKIQKNEWVNLWEFDDPKLFPEAIATQFLNNIRDDEINWHQNIISHFHDSINDVQIACIKQCFKDAIFHWGFTKFGKPNHYEILIEVYFGDPRESKVKNIFFGIEPDTFYNEYRIVGVRILGSKWRIEKTIFAVDKGIYNWRTQQPDFTKPLSED